MGCLRVARIIETIEAEEKAELERWMVGMWAESRASYHAAIMEREMPRTKADEKRKVFDGKIQRAKSFREKHDAEWQEALSSPRHFGAFLGMGHILGEPEKREEKSLAEKAQDGYEAGRRVLKSLFSKNE